SLLLRHSSSMLQGPQLPPQSTSDSRPFFTSSSQLGAWHSPSAHTLLLQSVLCPQEEPASHARHSPPQSMSVSSPFLTSSPHVAGTQTPSSQAPVSQSLPT